jgi:hypothetical protein
VATAIVACGSDADELQQAHRKLFLAGKRGSERKIIAGLDKKSGEAMREMFRMAQDMGTKKQYLDALKADAKDAVRSYSEPKIDGDKATMAVTRKSGKVETIDFVKEDGRWKVSAPKIIRALPGIRAVHAATMRKKKAAGRK